MANAFGIKFVLVNDIQQILPATIFGGGPWIHLATVVRGFKEYICFKHQITRKVYVEEVDPTSPTLFKTIHDENEWNDLCQFLKANGIISIGVNQEIKIAKQEK